jgi:hypothetical protein
MKFFHNSSINICPRGFSAEIKDSLNGHQFAVRQADRLQHRTASCQGRQGGVRDEDALLQIDAFELGAVPGQGLESIL